MKTMFLSKPASGTGESPVPRWPGWVKTRMAVLVSAALGVLLSTLATAGSSKHPSLVDPAKAQCTTCHAGVLEGKVVHSPALDDCLVCHEFSKKEGQTIVALSGPQPALCVACHDTHAVFAEAKVAFSHAPVADACTNCHTPHSGAEPHLLKDPVQHLCLSCHGPEDVNKSHPVAVAKASCLGCHAPHGSAQKGMLAGAILHLPFAEKSCDACHQKGRSVRTGRGRAATSQAQTCYACHSDLEAKVAKGVVHSAVREGQCTGCHDPHLSAEKKLLKAKGTALCTGCHAAVKEKVSGAVVHAPAKEDCTGCHAPHQSEYPLQLIDNVPALCAMCHDMADKQLVKRHLGADLVKLVCVSCHDPHGGPKPKLLQEASTHFPFAEGACDSCHEGSAKKLIEDGGKALCTACHSDIEEKAQTAKVPHPAMEVDCTACHNPHASRQEKLVRLPAGGACLECHDTLAAGVDETRHGAIARWGCQACHEPHGGESPKLLRASGSALCLGCHDPRNLRADEGKDVVLLGRYRLNPNQAARFKVIAVSADGQHDHPVMEHRFSGKPTKEELARGILKFEGELSCMSCHDPHKGKGKSLPKAGPDGAPVTCSDCHKK